MRTELPVSVTDVLDDFKRRFAPHILPFQGVEKKEAVTESVKVETQNTLKDFSTNLSGGDSLSATVDDNRKASWRGPCPAQNLLEGGDSDAGHINGNIVPDGGLVGGIAEQGDSSSRTPGANFLSGRGTGSQGRDVPSSCDFRQETLSGLNSQAEIANPAATSKPEAAGHILAPKARRLSDDDELPCCPACHGERDDENMCMVCADKGFVRERDCPSVIIQVWRDFEPIQAVATLYSNGDVIEACVAEPAAGYESGYLIELSLEEQAEAKRAWIESNTL